MRVAFNVGAAARVSNGSKLWLFNYRRPVDKKRTNIGLGSYPDTSLKKALSKRGQFNEWLADGLDPKLERQQEQLKAREDLATTFEAVYRRWLGMKEGTVAPSYRKRMVDAIELTKGTGRCRSLKV